jgi:hypothetical protein
MAQVVSSFNLWVTGNPVLTENAELIAGTNITISQVGTTITIDSITTALKGDPGEKGDKGDQGEPGIGINGTNGEKGDQGEPGIGINGTNGTNNYRNIVTLDLDIPSTASTSYQNITNFYIPVTSGQITRWEATILYNTSAATIGLRCAVNGGSNSFLTYFTQTGISTTGSAGAGWENAQFSYNAGTASSASATTNGNILLMSGAIKPTADYNLQFTFAPETATANGIIIKSGSTIEYW